MDTMTIVSMCLVIWFSIGVISSIRLLIGFTDIKVGEVPLVILMSFGGLIIWLVYYLLKHDKTIFFKKRK